MIQEPPCVSDFATMIIRDGKVPTDWEQSFNVCLDKGKGDALDRGNYRGLKLPVRPRKRHYRCSICGSEAAGEISNSEQEASYCLRGHREHV